MVNDLTQHLVVKHEVVVVRVEVDRLQHLAAKGPVAGVIFGKLIINEEVLRSGQKPIGDMYLYSGMPPLSAPLPRMRLARTTG